MKNNWKVNLYYIDPPERFGSSFTLPLTLPRFGASRHASWLESMMPSLNEQPNAHIGRLTGSGNIRR